MEAIFSRSDAFRRLMDSAAGPADRPLRLRTSRPGSAKPTPPTVLRERGPSREFVFSERHLKCAWFDDAVRPALLKTDNSAGIVVDYPGRWNLEAGPDFLGAALRVGPERRRLTGDVEIHVHPSDWRRHGHDRDPAYTKVIAHVTWFPGRLADGNLPAESVHISLQDSLSADPLFSFESLDVTAYPYAQRTAGAPCARRLATWTPDALADLFESAGEERLRRKAERMANAINAKGPDQVLYEELMTALGYKHNRMPFRALAERCPLTRIREDSERDVTTAYALLLGIAGLLPTQTESRWDPETRALVRQLWNRWWKHQARWRKSRLAPGAWKLSGIRPQNHPRRRLMAAAFLLTQRRLPTTHLVSLPPLSPPAWIEQVMAWLQPHAGSYWRNRLVLGGRRHSTQVSLTGKKRAAAILVNVILPFMAAWASQGGKSPAFPGIEILRHLPPAEDNSIVRQTASYLLGPDHNPRLYRNGLRQQGLVQIFHDFCLNDRSHCAACPLLKNLEFFSRQT